MGFEENCQCRLSVLCFFNYYYYYFFFPPFFLLFSFLYTGKIEYGNDTTASTEQFRVSEAQPENLFPFIISFITLSFLLLSPLLPSFLFSLFFLLHIIERHGKAKKKSVFVSTNPVIIIIFGKTCSDSTAECKMLVFV